MVRDRMADIIKPLIEIIDPLNYKENLTMPKLVRPSPHTCGAVRRGVLVACE